MYFAPFNLIQNMSKIYALFISLFLAIPALLQAQMAHVPNEILVQFKAGANPENAIKRHIELNNRGTSLSLGAILSQPMNIYRLYFDGSGVQEDMLLKALRNDRDISLAQFNHYVEKRETFPNDPQTGSQWHHKNTGQLNGTVGSDIKSELAWDITTGGVTALGDTIVVCVIEGGNLNHPDLIENAWVNHGEVPDNGIDDDENGYVDDYLGWDVNSESDGGNVLIGDHGTAVMGMIGAKGDNNLGVVGANWNVKIMSVAGENLGDEASVIAAYAYPLVQRKLYNETEGEIGAFVVATNASWGIDNGNPNDVPLWSAYYDTLGTYGILNCGATANNDVDIDVVGDIPTAAESDYMISVTATNVNDVRTFSAFGATTIDLGAPGENVFTTSGSSGYGGTSGTSFASPLTAGVIALLYSVPCESFAELVKTNPQLGADYVRYSLFEGVDIVPNLVGQTVTGGRLNAFNSLSLMESQCGEDICLPPFSFDYTVSEDTIYNFTWTLAQLDSVNIRYREIGAEEWTIIENITDENFEIDSLERCKNYEFQIASRCSNVDGDFAYGISRLVETAGCCLAPEEIFATEITVQNVLIGWETGFGIDSYDLYYRVEGDADWILYGAFDTGLALLDSLEGCTYYEVLVVPACSDDFEDGEMILIRTKDCGLCIDAEYCESFGESSFFEYIDEVSIGAYTSITGNNDGYLFIDDTGVELAIGQSYITLLTPGFAFGDYNEYFRVWIDLNQNGSFTSDEIVLSSESGSSQPLEGEIMIPSEALPGQTRLRVSMKYVGNSNASVAACEQYDEGETEDYCVTIVDALVSTNDPIIPQGISIFPNPGPGLFQIDNTYFQSHLSGGATLRVYDITGKKILQQGLTSGRSQLDLRGLNTGLYLYQVIDNNGLNMDTGKIILSK